MSLIPTKSLGFLPSKIHEKAERVRQQCRKATWRIRGVVPLRPIPTACECCDKVPTDGRRLNADHDHVTGIFRGWICWPCNTAIGALGDNLAGVNKAAAYLTRASVASNLPLDINQQLEF